MRRISLAGIAMGPLLMAVSSEPFELRDRFLQGDVVERVVCREDSKQSYALYLPTRYSPERHWPILYCLDARGRALTPVERFREAAERYGYILVSSYNTRSDEPAEPSIDVIRTLWRDTHLRFAIDARRAYMVGFSGLARVACLIADAAPGSVAGSSPAVPAFLSVTLREKVSDLPSSGWWATPTSTMTKWLDSIRPSTSSKSYTA